MTGNGRLLHELEFKGNAVPFLPSHLKSEEKSITVIDSMAIIQKVLAIAKLKSIDDAQTSIQLHPCFKYDCLASIQPS